MATELSYVLLTPYSIRKSRTGGILSRLLSRTGLDLVAARMFAPSETLVKAYAGGLVTDEDISHRAAQEQIREYVLHNFSRKASGTLPRVMMLVFKGEEGAAWTTSDGRTRTWPEWREWLGRRAGAGKLAPKGFPASKRFRPK